MMSEQPQFKYSVSWMDRIHDVDPAAWDALALPLKTPFLEWEWLNLMETSGSIATDTGWQPKHLTIWSGQKLVAAAPLYLKSHSAGEFVFDQAWADLADRLGMRYYPKLVGMSPVTPVPGYRFLMDPQEDEAYLTKSMVIEVDRFCRSNQINACSFLYVDPQWRRHLSAHGFNDWLHQSYAWQNRDYRKFEDYLAKFNSNQRRNIRRERRKVRELGIRIKPFFGDDIPRSLLSLMYRFYVRTNEQYGPWSCKYLTKAFFNGLYDCYRHRLLLMVAYHENHQEVPIGMSLFLTKGDLLFGRYWGSFDFVDLLHFNTCYYSPIEWAIKNSIQHFDPGIGAYHKLRRGFKAIPNFSLHKFYAPRLQMIMRTHINEINRLEQEQIDAMNAELPFAKANNHTP